jgi:uncharacterized protein
MNTTLDATEARIVGCLIEKQITTPDQYPLSLNALVNACNQKSNRDPMLDLDEQTVQASVDGLVRRHLILEKSGFGSRVPKYHQIFCNAEFGSLKLTPLETAIVCELLVRGPQTPGELRTRASRMAPVAAVEEVDAALEKMAARSEGALVVRLPKEPSRRDARYAQLFTGMPSAIDPQVRRSGDRPAHGDVLPAAQGQATNHSNAELLARIEALEAAVESLRGELARINGGGA